MPETHWALWEHRECVYACVRVCVCATLQLLEWRLEIRDHSKCANRIRRAHMHSKIVTTFQLFHVLMILLPTHRPCYVFVTTQRPFSLKHFVQVHVFFFYSHRLPSCLCPIHLFILWTMNGLLDTRCVHRNKTNTHTNTLHSFGQIHSFDGFFLPMWQPSTWLHLMSYKNICAAQKLFIQIVFNKNDNKKKPTA